MLGESCVLMVSIRVAMVMLSQLCTVAVVFPFLVSGALRSCHHTTPRAARCTRDTKYTRIDL